MCIVYAYPKRNENEKKSLRMAKEMWTRQTLEHVNTVSSVDFNIRYEHAARTFKINAKSKKIFHLIFAGSYDHIRGVHWNDSGWID